ncbi:MAG: right-handed parallel beta-helix repeat-containing protein [Planctomycetes bacterium]|nr:right-handed parallel beta-helix repeat-containing protein [Planctomycetota bacterium]
MKHLKYIIIILLMASPAWGTTYYMREDGSAANKEAATSCGAANTSMSVAMHNSETFSAGDVIELCDDGGNFTSKLTVPSSGSAGSPITYQEASGDTVVIDLGDADSHAFEILTKNYITIQDLTLTDVGGDENALIFLSDADNIIVNGVTTIGDGDAVNMVIGIDIKGDSDNVTVKNCDISGGEIGIRVWPNAGSDAPSSLRIHDNVIHDIDEGSIVNGDGIMFVGPGDGLNLVDIVIEKNNIYNCNDECLDLYAAKNVTVRYNRLHDSVVGSGGDELAIKIGNEVGTGQTGIVIHNNLAYNFHGAGFIGHYFDGTIYNNTITNTARECIEIRDFGSAGGKTIINNILDTCGTGGDYCNLKVAEADKMSDVDNNIYSNAGYKIVSWDGTEYSDLATYQAAVTPIDANSDDTDPVLSDYKIPMSGSAYEAGDISVGIHCLLADIGFFDPDCGVEVGVSHFETGTAYFETKMP